MNIPFRAQILNITNKTAIFFFGFMALSFPISGAGVEIAFSFIVFCVMVRGVLAPPAWIEVKSFFKNRANLAVLIFYICIGLSIFVSPLPAKSFGAWFSKWGEGVLLFYFAQIFLEKRHIKIMICVLCAATFLVCLDGIYQWHNGVDFIRGIKIAQAGVTITATFHSSNNFSTFLILMFFASYGLFYSRKEAWSKILLIVLALLIVANLSFAHSRSSWLALVAVSLLIVAFLGDRKSKLFFGCSLLIFALALFQAPSLVNKFLYIVWERGDPRRLALWRSALLMFRESPLFGKGLGTFMDYICSYTSKVNKPHYAHNCYLQILAETGIVGLVSFLWFLREIIAAAALSLIRKFDGFFAGLFFGLIAFLIDCFFDNQLYSLRLGLLFWFILGLIAIYLNSAEREAVPVSAAA